MLDRPGPAVVRGRRCSRRSAGERPEGAPAHPHPLRPRRRGRRARAPLAGPAGLRPRARRAAPGRPGQARRLAPPASTAARRASRACGARSCRSRRPTCASSRAARPASRAPSRVEYTPGHASHHVCYLHEPSRPAPSSATWPACACRRTSSRWRRPRRPTSTSRRGSARSTTIAGWEPEALALTHFGPVDDPRRAVRPRPREPPRPGRARRAEHDEDGFVEALRRAACTREAGEAADAILQAAPPDQLLPRPRAVARKRAEAAEAGILRLMRRRRRAPADEGPGSGLGDNWRVIVRNDDHNTFDHVARTLARCSRASASSRATPIADVDPQRAARRSSGAGMKEPAELYWEQLNDAGLTMAPLEQG